MGFSASRQGAPTIRTASHSARRLILIVMLAISAPSPMPLLAQASADTELAQFRAQILGSRPRLWVKERVVQSMGVTKSCTAGETYSFRPDGAVYVTRCIDRMLQVDSSRRWSLQRLDALDVQLSIGAERYLLSFGGTARAPQMRWRRLASAKDVPTEDIYLALSKD